MVANIEHLPEIHEQLGQLKLPRTMILLDVNGTLFSDDSKDGYISPQNISELQQKIAHLETKGVSVGLCSDSPLLQLVGLAKKLGINGPIVGENGNIIYFNGLTTITKPLVSFDLLYEKVQEVAKNLVQVNDAVSPEFGGYEPNFSESQWAFGAGRQTSLAVFGPTELINALGETFKDFPGISVDCSPEFNFFAIHPGEDFTKNKGQALAKLSSLGHQILLVGNSQSDWVERESGVLCAFVGGSRISPEIAQKADYVSHQPTISGVIEILETILSKE